MAKKQTPQPQYNVGTNADLNMQVEFAINDYAEAIVFHDKPFTKSLSWLEYDLDSHRLDFVMEDGEIRNFGIPINPSLAKYMQNAFQVLLVLMDQVSGEPVEGDYYPLVIHRG